MENLSLHHKLRLAAAVSLSGLVFYATAAATVSAAPPAKKATPKPATKATAKPTSQTGFTDNTPLTEQQKIVHLLNRAAFGPRPGDVDRVKAMGINAYIDEQLHPERISDAAIVAKLAPLNLLQMPNEELTQGYYDALKNGKELKVLQAKIERQTKTQNADNTAMMDEETPEKKRQKVMTLLRDMTPEERTRAQELMQGAKGKGAYTGTPQLIVAKTIRAVESPRQLQEVMVDFWTNHFNIDARKNACRVLKVSDDRDVIQKYTFAHFRDLLEASAKSPAMLVYLDNAQSTGEQTADPAVQEQQKRNIQRLQRQAALGNEKAKKNLARLQEAQAKVKKRKPAGLNENYAREIMELHTLGVDGGYTQKDVTEVARCLTGWTIERNTGTFKFDPRRHDNGEKVVLGQTIPAGGGIEDGEKVLDMLASSPATMKHVSYQLCQRLVADEPPASLVNKCVATWKSTSGDMREIVRTILTSPEFNSRAAYRQKIKSPFEYAVSSARAVGATYVFNTPEGRPRQRARQGAAAFGLVGKTGNAYNGNANVQFLPGQVAVMGQPLFQFQPPTGYPEDSRKWVSSGALISRLNFSLALTRGKIGDLDLTQMHDTLLNGGQGITATQYVSRLADALLSGDVSPATRATLLKEAKSLTETNGAVATTASNTPTGTDRETAQKLVALVLGSPEFQRR
jgi:uncharacterized protein (DUF1800 family)